MLSYSDYLCCPKCKSDIQLDGEYLICKNCNTNYEIKDGIPVMMSNISSDIQLSIKKWDKMYKKNFMNKQYYEDYENYISNYYWDTYNQIVEVKKVNKDVVYLEIGCGPFFIGQKIANKCKIVIGIDMCPTALKIARKMLKEKGIDNFLLIQGNILNLPIKNNIIDIIYGGGVIEHFKNTTKCIDELYKVLRKGGISFNTVPYLNLGALTYRQVWGNIPNFPVLKQFAEFVHIILLKSRHMIFGYDMSFLGTTLKRLHKKVGFEEVNVDKFKVKFALHFIPHCIRYPVAWLAKNSRLF